MSAFWGEFFGTLFLILLGNGIVANVVLKGTKGNNSGWIVITMGWGFAVFTGVVVAQEASGAHLNPAVTLGLAVAGSFPWESVLQYMLAQMLGAATGAALVWLTYRDHYAITEDQGLKQATFCTAPAIPNSLNNLFSEFIGTFVLIFGVLFIAGPNFESADPTVPAGLGSLGAVPVSLIVIVIGMAIGGTTGYAINPARDLSPRIMHALLPISGKGGSNWSYAWIPVVGPLLGGVSAAFLYLIF